MRQPPSLEHLVALSDETGIIQHAVLDVPNRSTGYCTDDVARAFMVACAAAPHERHHPEALRLARIYLSFLHDAQMPDGRFHNFMSYERAWLDEVGTEDSIGRAIWSLGFGMRFAPKEGWRSVCATMLDRALPNVRDLQFPRARAYAALGISHAFEATGRKREAFRSALRDIGASLTALHDASKAKAWDWFEPFMTYDNARLPEAALRIGLELEDSALVDLGLRTLDFYESVVMCDGIFVPIGNDGWYVQNGRRARYGQQPLEAVAMVDAELVAHAATGDFARRRSAETALEWYYGRNSRSTVMSSAGGCFDGLEEVGVNHNMGAESTLAYLAGALALAQPRADVLRIAR